MDTENIYYVFRRKKKCAKYNEFSLIVCIAYIIFIQFRENGEKKYRNYFIYIYLRIL